MDTLEVTIDTQGNLISIMNNGKGITPLNSLYTNLKRDTCSDSRKRGGLRS